jgi:hypothetical protein
MSIQTASGAHYLQAATTSVAFNNDGAPFTVSFWAYLTSVTSATWLPLASTYNADLGSAWEIGTNSAPGASANAPTAGNLYLAWSSATTVGGAPVFQADGAANINSNTPAVPTNRWVHLAVRYNTNNLAAATSGTNYDFWYDGRLVGSPTTTFSAALPTGMSAGQARALRIKQSADNAGQNPAGMVAQFRMFRGLLTGAELRRSMMAARTPGDLYRRLIVDLPLQKLPGSATYDRDVGPLRLGNWTATGTVTYGFNPRNVGVRLQPNPLPFLSPVSGGPVSGVGTAAGDSTAAAVGASLRASVGTASGDSTAAAVGRSTAVSVGTASGDSAAAAAGRLTATATGTASGDSTAAAVSAAAGTGTGTASADSTATAVGISTARSAGTAAGDSTATAATAKIIASVGSAAGDSTAAAVGRSNAATVGSAAGDSSASGSTVAPSGSTVVGSAGTFSDASGHANQSHLVYAANVDRWWLFTLSSTADTARSAHTVFCYYSSGSDLATATWTEATGSRLLFSANTSTDTILGSGRSLGVAYLNAGGNDVVHVRRSVNFDGQNGDNVHTRGVLGTTSITWGSNTVVTTPAASEWQGTPHGDHLAISTNGRIHSFSSSQDFEIDANALASTNLDSGTSWTAGFTTNPGGSRPPSWMFDGTMTHECKALAFAPLASGVMLAVYSNGALVQPDFSNLRYKKSGADNASTMWPDVGAGGGGGDGNVFAGTSTQNVNDWCLLGVSTSTIYAFRRSGSTSLEWRTYSTGGNSWSSPSGSIPSQATKAGAGMFATTDGTDVWLFVVDSDTNNTVRYCKYNSGAGTWGTWTALVATTKTRGSLAGFQRANDTSKAQLGVVWSQVNGSNYDVTVSYLDTLNTVAGVGTAAGDSSAAAVGRSTATAAGTAAGDSTASAVGRSAVAAIGTASADSTATAVGRSLAIGIGTSLGDATAGAVGRANAASAGTIVGDSTATAVGRATALVDGLAAGDSTASAFGASLFAAAGSATGTSDASGVGASSTTGQGVGTAVGIATATAVGRSIAASVSSTTGDSTAAAAGHANVAVSGTVSGDSTASSVGRSTIITVGAAAGDSTAAGVGSSAATGQGVGTANGIASAAAVGRGIAVSGASAVGDATATAGGSALAVSVGVAAGDSAATAWISIGFQPTWAVISQQFLGGGAV